MMNYYLRGQITAIVYPDGVRETRALDNNGNAIENAKIAGEFRLAEYGMYDAMSRITQKIAVDGLASKAILNLIKIN